MSLIKRIYIIYRLLLRFLLRGLWEPTTGGVRRVVIGVVRRLVVTTRLFVREGMAYRASALTYSSLLSVVPLLAIIFAIAKGFGLAALIEQWMRDNIAAKPEITDTLVGFVQSYLDHTQGGVFLGFGLLMLLWTLFNLTNSIESTFNQIWLVKHQRTAFRMLMDYTAIFFLLPVFIIATSGLNILAYSAASKLVPDIMILRPTALVLVQGLPYVVVCLFFTGLFIFMPNTRVSFGSALKAGIPTGLLFQILQLCYVHSQLWISSYNAIYGSFAALPLFMLMCQLSWLLTLFGGTLCYVDQNIHSFYYGHDIVRLSHLDRDCLSVRLAAAICRRFAAAEPPLTAAELSERERVHLRLTTDVLYDLEQAGIIMKVQADGGTAEPVYLPAGDIHTLTIPRVLAALDREGEHIGRPVATGDEDFRRRRRDMFGIVFDDTPLHELKGL